MGRILISRRSRRVAPRACARAGDAGPRDRGGPNGNAAIERLHDGSFDLVLSDLKMGGSDGPGTSCGRQELQPGAASS